MKTIAWCVMAVIGMTSGAFGAEKKAAEIEAIRAELKPLRQLAYKEADVTEARRKLDEAYRDYWRTVRGAMLRLDPSKAALIEKDVKSREEAGAIARTTAPK